MAKPRPLTSSETEALQAFAARYGKQWKNKLAFEYWYNARVFRDGTREYPELHGLRNELGPQWLKGFKL